MAIIKTSWEKANEDEEKDNYTSIIPSGFVQKEYDSQMPFNWMEYWWNRCRRKKFDNRDTRF